MRKRTIFIAMYLIGAVLSIASCCEDTAPQYELAGSVRGFLISKDSVVRLNYLQRGRSGSKIFIEGDGAPIAIQKASGMGDSVFVIVDYSLLYSEGNSYVLSVSDVIEMDSLKTNMRDSVQKLPLSARFVGEFSGSTELNNPQPCSQIPDGFELKGLTIVADSMKVIEVLRK